MSKISPCLFFVLMALLACSKDGFVDDYSIPDQVVTKVTLNDGQTEFMKTGNQFSLNLLDKAYTGQNLVLSPLSLQMALAMTLNGAAGETAQEIKRALGYGANTEKDINEYYKHLMEQFPNVDKSITLNLLNGIVTDVEFTLKKVFKNTLKEYYYAPAESYPFESSETLKLINDWAGRNTEWQVYPLLDKLPGDAVSVILDAVYFKARWRCVYNFKTESRDFINEHGNSARRDFMCSKVGMPYYGTDVFQLIELPYAQDIFTMYVMLPREQRAGSCKDLIASLSEEALSATFRSVENKYVSVILPQYEIESSLKLKDQLKMVGIEKAFDKYEADFTGMCETDGKRLWIDNVHQKTVFKVTKWGTEAASGTAVVHGQPIDDMDLIDDDGAIVFNANHPFLFFVVERGTGAILFEGVFSGEEVIN